MRHGLGATFDDNDSKSDSERGRDQPCSFLNDEGCGRAYLQSFDHRPPRLQGPGYTEKGARLTIARSLNLKPAY